MNEDHRSGPMVHRRPWTSRHVSQGDLQGWDDARSMALAEMSYSAAPDFYDLIPLPHEAVVKLIVEQLGAPETETSDLHVLSRDGAEAAMLCALPSEALNRAKQDATLALIRRLDRASKVSYMAALGAYTPTVEPFYIDSFYLTRIASGAKRSGAGTAAMERFIELGAGRVCGLHVKVDNLPAISLYRKFGFRFVSDGPYRFRAMVNRP